MRVVTAVVVLIMSCFCLCEELLLPKHVFDSHDPGADDVETNDRSLELSPFNASLNITYVARRFRRDAPKTIDCMNLNNSNTLKDEDIFNECKMEKIIAGNRESINFNCTRTPFVMFINEKEEVRIPLIFVGFEDFLIRGDKLLHMKDLSASSNPNLEKILFPKLIDVNNMTIVNNPKLKIVDLRELKKIKEFTLVNNTKDAEQFDLKLDALEESHFVNISGNLKLTSLEMPKLMICLILQITENDNLTTISLTELGEVFTLQIQNNSQLTKIDLPKLYYLTDFVLSENFALKEFDLKTIKSIRSQFIVERNTVLQELNFPTLTHLSPSSSSSNVMISNNSQLTKVVLGNKAVDLMYKAAALIISRNPSLSKVVLGKLEDLSVLKNIAIYGNRKLRRAEIELQCPENSTDCYIQGDYECIFDEPISDLSELDGCLNIYGDLVLKPSVAENTKTSTTISKIQGNLTIVNSTLALKDLHFLENTVILGDVYIETCGSRLFYSNFTWQVEGKVSFSSGDVCDGNCTAYDLLVEKKDDCKVVYGEIQMGWEPYTEVDVRNFKVIEKVVGKISFFNIFPDKDTTGPLEFTNLETIETPEGGRSVYMNSNSFYKEHPFPNLNSVINPNKFVLEITHNSFEIKIEDLFKWEEELTNKKFDPYEIFPFLPGPKLVTELIEIDEKSLNFDVDYDNNGGASTFAASSLSIALLLFYLLRF